MYGRGVTLANAVDVTTDARVVMERLVQAQSPQSANDAQMAIFNLAWNDDDREYARQLLAENWELSPDEILNDEQLEDEWGYLLDGPDPSSAEGRFLLWLAELQARKTPVQAPDCGTVVRKFRAEHVVDEQDVQNIRMMIRSRQYVKVSVGRGGQAKYCVSSEWYEHYARVRDLLN